MKKILIALAILNILAWGFVAQAEAEGPQPGEGLRTMEVVLTQYAHKPWLSTYSEAADLWLRQHGWELNYRYVLRDGAFGKIVWHYIKEVPATQVVPFVWVPRVLVTHWWAPLWGDWRCLRVYTN